MLDSFRSARLLIRCWKPEDGQMLKEAIDSSLPELQSWVPWAMHEPSPLNVITERLIGMREQFRSGEDWAFGIFSAEETRVLGGAGLHPRGSPDHLEIGYWIRTDANRLGFASETAAVLCAVGFDHTNVQRLEIHCDAENSRSAAVAKRLGFQLTRTFHQEAITTRGLQRLTQVWTLARVDFAN